MIQLPIHRCPECGYIGRTASFLQGEDGPWEPQPLFCPRCGHEVGQFDPRLQ